MDLAYYEKFAHKMAIVFLIVGALNWLGIGLFRVNLAEKLLGRSISRAVYIVVGVCALAVMFHRDTYLPFLGETVMPCSVIPESIPERADIQVEVRVAPGAKVVYWAAEPATERLHDIHDWRKAYLKFMNAGCVHANDYGVAVLLVRNPQPYSVPLKGRLEPHVHYRSCGDGGMMGRIETVFLSKGKSV